VECDQAMLVRKERRCEVLQEIRKRHLAGAKPARSGQPGGSVANLATGMQGRMQEAGRQRARRCVGTRTSEPCEVSLEKEAFPSVQGIPRPEDHGTNHHPMAQDGGALGGVSVYGAFEEDDSVTWDTRALGGDTGGRRRGRPKSGPACVAGVGGAL
jgi:hypothetical protein